MVSQYFIISTLWSCTVLGGNTKRCFISQYSSDGFGHQLEGKLSCFIAGYLSSKLQYVHIPYDRMQHTPGLVALANSFMNFTATDNVHAKETLQDLQLYHHVTVNTSWIRQVVYDGLYCDSNTLYIMDNCWELTYRPPMVHSLTLMTKILQKMYFSTSKPSTGYNTSRINIAVHIRRGDARARLLPTDYYRAGINFYRQKYFRPVFWLLSDEPKWPGLRALKYKTERNKSVDGYKLSDDIHLPLQSDPASTMFLTFHRIVMADGIVLSRSSLSSAAALVSNASILVTTSKHKGTPREGWYSTARFVRLQ